MSGELTGGGESGGDLTTQGKGMRGRGKWGTGKRGKMTTGEQKSFAPIELRKENCSSL